MARIWSHGPARRINVPQRVGVVAAAMIMAGSLAACDSGESGSGPKGSGDAAAAAKAQAVIETATQQPTELGVTEPVGKPVPTGKRITLVTCPTPECSSQKDIAKQATDALGWTLKVVTTDGSPEKTRTAFEDVVRDKPDGVIYVAIDKSTFASYLPQIKANGTFVAGYGTLDKQGDGLDFFGSFGNVPAGQMMAAWIAAKSSANAEVLYADLSAYSILQKQLEDFKASMDEYCPGCKTDVFDVPLSAIGVDVPTRIVSYLRSHPNVNYVAVCTDSLALGLPAALKAAGLADKVKIVGESPIVTTQQYVADGQMEATVAFADYEMLWELIDAIVRHEAGVPQVEAKYPPQAWILTRDNIPSPSERFPMVKDSFDQYKKLWGVS